jgi:hypothetical protein
VENIEGISDAKKARGCLKRAAPLIFEKPKVRQGFPQYSCIN